MSGSDKSKDEYVKIDIGIEELIRLPFIQTKEELISSIQKDLSIYDVGHSKNKNVISLTEENVFIIEWCPPRYPFKNKHVKTSSSILNHVDLLLRFIIENYKEPLFLLIHEEYIDFEIIFSRHDVIDKVQKECQQYINKDYTLKKNNAVTIRVTKSTFSLKELEGA